jgi:hypothetical protein
MKLISILTLLICLANSALAQDLKFDSLLEQMEQANYIQKSLEIEEIKGVYQLSVWHFVPSLNYDFINNNYYLTISSSAFVSNMIGRRQEKKKLSAIERRYDQKNKTDEIKLKSLYVNILHNFESVELSRQILLNDIEIYKIKKQEHQENEIDTESYLQAKSGILNKIKNHNNEVTKLQSDFYQLEALTEQEFQITLDSLYISSKSLIQ